MGEHAAKSVPSYPADENTKWCRCFAKQSGKFHKRLNITLPCNPAVSLLGTKMKSKNICLYKNLYMHCS